MENKMETSGRKLTAGILRDKPLSELKTAAQFLRAKNDESSILSNALILTEIENRLPENEYLAFRETLD
jgi:hypothetical protein